MTRRLVRTPKVRTRIWWAAMSRPDGLPLLFSSRQMAELCRFRDEQLVRVRVEALHPAERVLKLPATKGAR